MNKIENLTQTLTEEACEIGQRASKANRFGWHEVQDGQTLNNSERLVQEFIDLAAVMLMLENEGLLKFPFKVHDSEVRIQIVAKQERVSKMLEFSKKQGTLNDYI